MYNEIVDKWYHLDSVVEPDNCEEGISLKVHHYNYDES